MGKYLESNLNYPQQLADSLLKSNQATNQREFSWVDYSHLLAQELRVEMKAQ